MLLVKKFALYSIMRINKLFSAENIPYNFRLLNDQIFKTTVFSTLSYTWKICAEEELVVEAVDWYVISLVSGRQPFEGSVPVYE